MRAAVLHEAADLRIEQRPEPELAAGETRVRVRFGGICGSDLSYFRKGGVGDFKLREPMVLGHEIAGEVVERAPDGQGPNLGTPVAIDPGRPCTVCTLCRSGRAHLCREMRFLGSAARFPHVQGGFSQTLVVASRQCVALPPGMSLRLAACAEPLAVALHAVRRAGDLLGRTVLVAGSGPIGLLVVAATRLAGAASIVATDLENAPLEAARAMGADRSLNLAQHDPDALSREAAASGGFDIAVEATGAPASLAALPALLRPGGRIVQLGSLPAGATPVPMNVLMSREIDLIGSFRFHMEFETAAALLASGRIDLAPILSATLPLDRATDAFRLAADKTRAIKVHLDLD